jgi:molecular chaperone Hsp33
MTFQDQSQRFIFNHSMVRGELVNLTESYQEILKRSPYPQQVQELLGQSLVAVTLLSATIKYQGSIILQTQSDGPVSLLLAQANAMREIRGLAKWQGEVTHDFSQAVGKGHLAITVDPRKDRERYQGIVELTGNNLAQVIENYFLQSEQLPTIIILAANTTTAAGILLQLLPQAKHEDESFWQHIEHLARTLTSEELLTLAPEQILHRLFHQEEVTTFDPKPIQFVCRCSRDAMANAILTLGHDDAVKLASEHQVVSVTCEFCNQKIDFDRVDVERIFTDRPLGDDRILH